MPLTRAQLRQRDDAPTPVSDLLALTPFSEPDVLMPDSRENDPGNEGRSEGPLLHPENVSNRTNGDADSRVEDNGNLHDHNADANNEDHADAHDSDGGDSNADDDNANASDANAGDKEGDEDGDSESDRGAAKPSPGDASRRPVAKTRPAQILPAKRRRNTRSNAPSSKNRGVAELNSENEDEMDFKGCTEKKWEDRILLPNEMMLRGGNSTAFVHRLLGGEVIIVNYLDIYHASLKRFINENVLQIAVDLILRDKGCIPEEGWVWMHETMLASQIARNQVFERRVPPAPQMKAMMSSKVLLAPIHTASSHWSLLAIVNLNSLFEAALHVKPTKHLGHARIEIPAGVAKPLAIHFDSMHQSNHKSAAMLFRKFISFCLTAAWKEKNQSYYDRKRLTPNFSRFVFRNLTFVQGEVEQQEDQVTCGWRSASAVSFIAEHKAVSPQWESISKKSFVSNHVEIANRSLRFLQWKAQPSVSDIPSIFFPMDDVVDKVFCSEFECDMNVVNETLATFVKSRAGGGQKAKRNEKKVEMSLKFETVYERVADEMEASGLNMRMKFRKAIKMNSTHCRALARYIFPFPRGKQYASSLYYTRYNYPDSILVCTGLNLVLQKLPRVGKEAFATSGARVPKSKRVRHQIAVFLDWSRSKARRWDTNARFRLQELFIHFLGISEAILKSCCRQAMYNEDNATAQDLLSTEKKRREPGPNEIESDDDGEWSFDKSLTIEDGGKENGQIRSSVTPGVLGSALSSCLFSAEQVSNEAIMECLPDFENHCKRVLQLTSDVNISEVQCYVTGSYMKFIHTTFKKRFKDRLSERIRAMWGHVLGDAFIRGSLDKAISRLLVAAERYFTRNGKLFLEIRDDNVSTLLGEPVAHRRIHSRRKSTAQRRDDEADSQPEVKSSMKEGDNSTPVEVVVERVRDVKCFGGGTQTACLNVRSNPTPTEFLALVFYLLQGCRV